MKGDNAEPSVRRIKAAINMTRIRIGVSHHFFQANTRFREFGSLLTDLVLRWGLLNYGNFKNAKLH
jgi:hypothetical protein